MKLLAAIQNKILTYTYYLLIKLFNNNIKIKGIPLLMTSFSVFCCDRNDSKITVGKRFAHRQGTLFECCDGGRILLGDNVFFNRECIVTSLHEIIIENDCIFGPNVMIYDHDHLISKKGISKDKFKTAPIFIGEKSWIGASCIILKGTRIGKNCVIGAGTIVQGDIPDNSIVTMDRNLIIKKIN